MMDENTYVALAELYAKIEILNAMVINLTRHHVNSQPLEMREPTLHAISQVLMALRLKPDSTNPEMQRFLDLIELKIPDHAEAFLAKLRAQLVRPN